jgi:thiamine biosynthesis lipoprotein
MLYFTQEAAMGRYKAFMKRIPVFLVSVLILPLVFAFCSRPPSPQIVFALNTVCAVNLFEDGSAQLYSQIFSRIQEIDRTMSAFPKEFQEFSISRAEAIEMGLISGIVAINEGAGIAPVKVRGDLIEVLETALYYAELSGGAFDPTVGPLVQLWDIRIETQAETQQVPGDAEIAATLELVNWRDVIINREAGTVFLPRTGMALDFGAIAKGYAGDEAARIAREGNVTRAIIDLGGNIVVLGWRQAANETETLAAAAGTAWRIGIQNPLDGRGSYIGILRVHDTSIVTSGVYERFFIYEGKRYHHLFCTTSGYPADNGFLSVTVVTKSSMSADALSTAVFVMGFERGKALIDSLPDTEAVFVFDDHTVRITDGLAGHFTLVDDEFTLVLQ